MSLLSELSRGTGTVDGAVVGEGFEDVREYFVNKRSFDKDDKPSKSKVPSTYLTRRGNLVLYTRADQPPSWETQILDHYKDMGSLVSQLEDVALKKDEIRKEMDKRCTPGRAFNPYIGLLKNTLFFPKQGSSPGLDLIPSHLEEMGVNIAEFLQGKGSLSHLIPPEQVSDILCEFSKTDKTTTRVPIQESPENLKPESTLPTPAPPQSPLPDDNNQLLDINRANSLSAGTRRRSSARTPGSARSYGQYSDVDSAYGTNKLPPIHVPVRLSADLSTIQSESSNVLDIQTTKSNNDFTGNSSMPSIFNNSSDFTRPERPLYWMPEVSEATYSLSMEDVDHLHDDDTKIISEKEEIPEAVNHEKNGLKPSQIRTAEWINQNSESRTVSVTTTLDRDGELSVKAPEVSMPSFQAGSERISLIEQTTIGSVTEFQKLKVNEQEDSLSMDVTLPVSTEASQYNTGTFLDSEPVKIAVKATPYDHITTEGNLTNSADISASIERTFEGSEVSTNYYDNQNLMTIQSYRVENEITSVSSRKTKDASESERPRSSHPSSAVSSVTLNDEIVDKFPDRNASNAYAVPWSTSLADGESVVGKESGFSGDSVVSEDISKLDIKSKSSENMTQNVKPIKKSPRSERGIPVSNSPDTTSGVETNYPSAMASHVDHQPSNLDAAKTEIIPLLERTSPVGDRIGTPILNVKSPSPMLQPERVPSVESLSPRPPSAPRPRSATVTTSPKRQVRPKPSKTPRRSRGRSLKPKQNARSSSRGGRTQQPPEPPLIQEIDEEEQARIDAERAALAAAAAAEKQRRLAQAAALQNQIQAAEEQRIQAEKEAERRRLETEAELKALAAEEESMRLMEEEARQQMMMSRKEAREAREKRRKDELERKKEEIRRRKEEDIRRQEQANKREREMLDRLGDPNLRQRIAADDAARRAQQERELEERLLEEEQMAAERAAAEEKRMEEFERLAEEEAISRLREDMDEVDERRRVLQSRAEILAREKEERRLAALAEERKMEEARKLEEELARRKEEEAAQARIRLELEEEDLRLRLQKDAEERHMELMKRREHNLELRTDLQNLHHRQQITRPWVFSYFVHWPRELFERPIGGEVTKAKRFRFPPKSAPKSNNSLPPL